MIPGGQDGLILDREFERQIGHRGKVPNVQGDYCLCAAEFRGPHVQKIVEIASANILPGRRQRCRLQSLFAGQRAKSQLCE